MTSLKSRPFLKLVLSACILMSWPAAVSSIPPKRILIVTNDKIESYTQIVQGFSKTVKKQNAVEITSIDPFTLGLEKAVRSHRPDLLLAVGAVSATNLLVAIKDIPIVTATVYDPPRSPENTNVTSFVMGVPIISQFKIIKDISPEIRRIGVLFKPDENEELLREAKEAASRTGLVLHLFPVVNEKSIPRIRDMKADIVWLMPNTIVYQSSILSQLYYECLEERTPIMGGIASHVKKGALFALTPDFEDMGNQMGETALNILAGAKPSNFLINAPRTAKLILNMKMARKLRISIPSNVIKSASEVVDP